MKICFWIGNAYYRAAGTNRIVGVIADKLSESNEVSLVVTDLPECESVFGYAESIAVHRLPFAIKVYRQGKTNPRALFNSFIRVFNNKTGFFDTESGARFIKEAFYPRKILKQFIGFFNGEKFDVIIATGPEIMWLAVIAEELAGHVKKIGWQHNSFDSYVNTRGFMFWNKSTLLKGYIPKLNNFVVLNKYDREAYLEYLGIKSIFIDNALTFSSEEKSECTKKNFIFVGRITRQKGLFLLIKAFSLFCQYNEDWMLTVVGDGKLRNSVIKKVWKNKVQDRVNFAGFQKEVKKYYLNASVFLLPSKYEGWGLVVTEAFEMGLPVIAFDITPLDVIIDTGINGIIVQQYNVKKYAAAMLKLARDENLRKKMAVSATDKAKKFSLERIEDEWKGLF